MRTSRKLGCLVVFLILAGGGAYSGWKYWNRDTSPTVSIGTIDRVDRLDLLVSATGEIRAKEFVDIQAEIAGVIIDLPVTEGQAVKEGDVLLKIDPFQSKQDMEMARSQYDAAMADAGSTEVQIAYAEAGLKQDEFVLVGSQAELTREKLALDLAKKRYDREKKLFEDGVSSPDSFDAAESAWKVAADGVRVAEARVEQSAARINATKVSIAQIRKQHEGALRRAEGAKANLDRMDDLLRKTTITSPLSGVITKLNVEKGERAVPGIMSNPQATLMTIADLSVLEAEIRVDETDIINVALGKRAIVTVDPLPELEMEGTVTEIGHSPIQAAGQAQGVEGGAGQQGREFKVVIRLKEAPNVLRPGLTASADIYADSREKCLVVPLQAVTVREVVVDKDGKYLPPTLESIIAKEEEKKKNGDKKPEMKPEKDDELHAELEGVFVLEKDRARFRPIKLGIKGETDVELTDGLAEGERIVIGPYKVLRVLLDGDKVNFDENAIMPSKNRMRASKTDGAAR